MIKLKIKSGDTVQVIAGDHKGEKGKVLKVDREKNRAIVEGVNLVSKHTKPSAQNPQGGIIKKEAPIHISNLSPLWSPAITCTVSPVFIFSFIIIAWIKAPQVLMTQFS